MDYVQRCAIRITAAVGVSQRPGRPGGDKYRQLRGQPALHYPVEFNKIIQRYTIDKLQYKKVFVVNFVELIDLHDIFVDQICHQFGFKNKPLDKFLIVGITRQQSFYGNDFFKTLHSFELGLGNGTHAAGGKFPDYFVAAVSL